MREPGWRIFVGLPMRLWMCWALGWSGAGAIAASMNPDASQAQLGAKLSALAQDASTEITLPTPEGGSITFLVHRATIADFGLQLPVDTFAGEGLDDPTATLRLDVSPRGLHALVLRESADDFVVASGVARRLRDSIWPSGVRCETVGEPSRDASPRPYGTRAAIPMRTLRLAIAATGEFTDAAGGPDRALAAIASMVNQLNAIYERELACRFVLVAAEPELIFFDATSDPFAGDNPPTMLTQNTAIIDSIVGAGGYDVGHVLSASPASSAWGGTSGLAVLCSAGKAKGVSVFRISDDLAADPLNLFILAHELGHEFGAEHTFNGDATNNCALNRAATSAYEPGSGSTLMSYAGFCGPDNLAPAPDFYFHAHSAGQMQAHLATRTCIASTPSINTPPTVTVAPEVFIPARTPFRLIASATDPDGDPIAFRWEQFDLGSSRTLEQGDDGTGPIIRSRPASLSPVRSVPAWQSILTGTPDPGEMLPRVARSLHFRVTALDARADGTGRSEAWHTVTVVDAPNPFVVTAPAANETWSGVRTVEWSVAGTAAPPINAARVRISLSQDGGLTFPYVLSPDTPNDGHEAVILPNITTSQARILVEPVGKVFFAISPGDFSIAPSPPVAFALLGPPTIGDAAPAAEGNADGNLDPGERATLSIVLANVGTSSSAGTFAELRSLTPTARVLQPAADFGDVAPSAAAPCDTPFVIQLAPEHPCGSAVQLALDIHSAGGSSTLPFSLPTGTAPAPSAELVTAYTGPPIPIPDGPASGVPGPAIDIPFTVNGLVGPIANVRFRLDGTACSTASGSTTVGLSHNFVGDLVLTLISPAGTTVTLADRPGGPSNTGNNLCGTIFDDTAPASIASAASIEAPFTGTYRPASPLAAFDGENPNGTWILRCRDMSSPDAGTLRAFSLQLTTTLPPVCEVFCPCVADFDASGGTPDTTDIAAYFSAWLQGDPAADSDCSGGTPDTADIAEFFAAWLAGGC